VNLNPEVKLLVSAAFVLSLGACASTPPVVKRLDLPTGSEIAIVSFRDCLIADQEDCGGSGNTAGSVFARVFSASPRFKAVPLSRPVAPRESLTDDAAVRYAQEKGFGYVINGEVDEFYSVAPMTFRVDRAGVSIRLLRVSDGAVVAFYSQKKDGGSNFTTPDRIIEKIAERFRDAL
jgi:hypothetical protein